MQHTTDTSITMLSISSQPAEPTGSHGRPFKAWSARWIFQFSGLGTHGTRCLRTHPRKLTACSVLRKWSTANIEKKVCGLCRWPQVSESLSTCSLPSWQRLRLNMNLFSFALLPAKAVSQQGQERMTRQLH